MIAIPPRESRDREEEHIIELPLNATFADWFAKLGKLETGNPAFDLLLAELYESFDAELVNALTDLYGKPEAATTGILAFFEEHEIEQEDVEAYLPIRFVE